MKAAATSCRGVSVKTRKRASRSTEWRCGQGASLIDSTNSLGDNAMSSVMTGPLPVGGSWLDKERTIAGPGYSRWLVPPCALAIHLCIGMAYGFSVFWLPLSKSVGTTESVACPAATSFFADLLV